MSFPASKHIIEAFPSSFAQLDCALELLGGKSVELSEIAHDVFNELPGWIDSGFQPAGPKLERPSRHKSITLSTAAPLQLLLEQLDQRPTGSTNSPWRIHELAVQLADLERRTQEELELSDIEKMKIRTQFEMLQTNCIDQQTKDEVALQLGRSEVGLRDFLWSLQRKLCHRLSLLEVLLKETVAEKRKRIESELAELTEVEDLVQKIDIQRDLDNILPRSLLLFGNSKEETIFEHETEDAGESCSPVNHKRKYYSRIRNPLAFSNSSTSRYSTFLRKESVLCTPNAVLHSAFALPNVFPGATGSWPPIPQFKGVLAEESNDRLPLKQPNRSCSDEHSRQKDLKRESTRDNLSSSFLFEKETIESCMDSSQEVFYSNEYECMSYKKSIEQSTFPFLLEKKTIEPSGMNSSQVFCSEKDDCMSYKNQLNNQKPSCMLSIQRKSIASVELVSMESKKAKVKH